ncbi:MAG: hypothetical protein HQL50_02950 [Magnetococcales bacterium]|nr:hypothetical protein [Magnetococcales bacterium]
MALFGVTSYMKQQLVASPGGPKRDTRDGSAKATFPLVREKSTAAQSSESQETGNRSRYAYRVTLSPAAIQKMGNAAMA